jgi:hypothetical protein
MSWSEKGGTVRERRPGREEDQLDQNSLPEDKDRNILQVDIIINPAQPDRADTPLSQQMPVERIILEDRPPPSTTNLLINRDTMEKDTSDQMTRIAREISMSPSTYEKIYLSPPNSDTRQLRKTFANPTPL